MSSVPRRDVFDPDCVGVYHCYNRCSQRARLCGFDPVTQQDFSHRKDWIRDGLKDLAGAMAIDVLDYAVLDNHLHVILRNRPDVVAGWSDEEVVRRWWLVAPERRDEQGKPAEITQLELASLLADQAQVNKLRSRLSDISWLMRQLCQSVARRANKESNVTGRFFAPRFGCERILDEAGLLACSMYVNLNLVRAGMANTPEESEYTSAFDRIRGHMQRQQAELGQVSVGGDSGDDPDAWLAPLFLDERSEAYPTELQAADAGDDSALPAADASPSATTSIHGNSLGSPRASEKGYLPLTLEAYLTLLDWTGRQLRDGQQGTIPSELLPILQRLGIRPETWFDVVHGYDSKFRTVVGRVEAIRREALRRGRRWLQGLSSAAAVFL